MQQRFLESSLYKPFLGIEIGGDYVLKGVSYMLEGKNIQRPAQEIQLYKCSRQGVFSAFYRTKTSKEPDTKSKKLKAISFNKKGIYQSLDSLLKCSWENLPEEIRIRKSNSFPIYFLYVSPKKQS